MLVVRRVNTEFIVTQQKPRRRYWSRSEWLSQQAQGDLALSRRRDTLSNHSDCPSLGYMYIGLPPQRLFNCPRY